MHTKHLCIWAKNVTRDREREREVLGELNYDFEWGSGSMPQWPLKIKHRERDGLLIIQWHHLQWRKKTLNWNESFWPQKKHKLFTHTQALYNIFCIEIERKFKLKENGINSRVQWLKEEAHNPKVVNSNPSTRYWIDIFHINLL